MTADINWLLSKDDWIAFRTKKDLLHEPEDTENDSKKRSEILSGESFAAILKELEEWPGDVLKRHNDSKHLLHKLSFLADVGIKHNDGNIPQIIDKIKSHKSKNGVFQILMNISPRYGGTGQDSYTWMLCDAPTVLYSLAKMGLDKDEDILSAARYLAGLQDENGFRCKASDELGKFRGPGRKEDPCPYANLVMLKLLLQFGTGEFDETIEKSVNSILDLWRCRKERKEYLFGIGTDFKKTKAPLIWFDIIHVLDVLSNCKNVFEDINFLQMLYELENVLDEYGRLTAQSIYLPWKAWEFSNKKEPSRWLTFLSGRIFDRVRQKSG